MNTKFKALIKAAGNNYPNRRNTPNPAATPNKPPILPKLSTNYDLIMQNKANFQESQMNVNKVLTREYENKTLSRSGKNKANTKPNKANFRKAKMNVTSFLTKEYENISNCSLAENKANTNPIQTQTNPIYRGVASGEDGFQRQKNAALHLFAVGYLRKK